jgi:ribosomal protein L19
MSTKVIKRFRKWKYVVPKFIVGDLNYQISIFDGTNREYDNFVGKIFLKKNNFCN